LLAYRRREGAETLAGRANLVPGTFPEKHNMRLTWTALLNELANQAKLEDLVNIALEDPVAAGFRSRIEELLNEQNAPTQPPPHTSVDVKQSWWRGGEETSKFHHERLMEQRSRLIHIDVVRSIGEVSQSVARLVLRFDGNRGWGTGFLISSDSVLTNCHNVVDKEYGGVGDIAVEFDYELNPRSCALVCRGLVESIEADETHDWAVIRLDRAVNRDPIPLGTPFGIGKDDGVIIIQHPLGAPKTFALDAMAIRHVDDDRIQYVADTEKGSSGSPVFNLGMHLIALHHAEAEVAIPSGFPKCFAKAAMACR
jgi:S1-C subfamily serine protease